MRVAIVGSGYVGLVTGACLADAGHRVTCIDRDAARTESVAAGRSPFHEPGLDALLERVVRAGTLDAVFDGGAAMREADVILVAVGTPFDGRALDLSMAVAACEDAGRAIAGRTDRPVVAIKSTVVPGSTDGPLREAVERTSGLRAGDGFGMSANPEFLTEGRAIADFVRPDRIVVGGDRAATHERVAELYAAIPCDARLFVNNATAECIKYASNALLATAISFANEFANLCEQIPGADVAAVMDGVHRSHYLTVPPSDAPQQAGLARFLEAGCGFGGSCLPKDVASVAAFGRERGARMSILEAVLSVNTERARRLVARVARALGGLRGRRIAQLGLAFKPDTDDVRESPAANVLGELVRAGARVTAWDPVACDAFRRSWGDMGATLTDHLDEAITECEAIVIVTRWPHVEALPGLLAGRSDPPLVVDGRRMIDPDSVPRYDGVGRGPTRPQGGFE